MLFEAIKFHKLSQIDLKRNPTFNSNYFKKIVKNIKLLIDLFEKANSGKIKENSFKYYINELNVLKYFFTESINTPDLILLSLDFFNWNNICAFIIKFLREAIKSFLKNLIKFNLISEFENLVTLILKYKNVMLFVLKDEELITSIFKIYWKFSKNYFKKVKIFTKKYDYQDDNAFLLQFLTLIKASLYQIAIDEINMNLQTKFLNETNKNDFENNLRIFKNNTKELKENLENNIFLVNLEALLSKRLNFDDKIIKFFKDNKKIYITMNENNNIQGNKTINKNKQNEKIKLIRSFNEIIKRFEINDILENFKSIKEFLDSITLENLITNTQISEAKKNFYIKVFNFPYFKLKNIKNIFRKIETMFHSYNQEKETCMVYYNIDIYLLMNKSEIKNTLIKILDEIANSIFAEKFYFLVNPNINVFRLKYCNSLNSRDKIKISLLDEDLFLKNLKIIFENNIQKKFNESQIFNTIKRRVTSLLEISDKNNIFTDKYDLPNLFYFYDDTEINNVNNYLYFYSEYNENLTSEIRKRDYWIIRINNKIKKCFFNVFAQEIVDYFVEDILTLKIFTENIISLEKFKQSKFYFLIKIIKKELNNQRKIFLNYSNPSVQNSFANSQKINNNNNFSKEFDNSIFAKKIKHYKYLIEKLIHEFYQRDFIIENFHDKKKNENFKNLINDNKRQIENYKKIVNYLLLRLIKLYIKYFLNYKLNNYKDSVFRDVDNFEKKNLIDKSNIKNDNNKSKPNYISLFKLDNIFFFIFFYVGKFSFRILYNDDFLNILESRMKYSCPNFIYKLSFDYIIQKEINNSILLKKESSFTQKILKLRYFLKNMNSVYQNKDKINEWQINRISIELKMYVILFELQTLLIGEYYHEEKILTKEILLNEDDQINDKNLLIFNKNVYHNVPISKSIEKYFINNLNTEELIENYKIKLKDYFLKECSFQETSLNHFSSNNDIKIESMRDSELFNKKKRKKKDITFKDEYSDLHYLHRVNNFSTTKYEKDSEKLIFLQKIICNEENFNIILTHFQQEFISLIYQLILNFNPSNIYSETFLQFLLPENKLKKKDKYEFSEFNYFEILFMPFRIIKDFIDDFLNSNKYSSSFPLKIEIVKNNKKLSQLIKDSPEVKLFLILLLEEYFTNPILIKIFNDNLLNKLNEVNKKHKEKGFNLHSDHILTKTFDINKIFEEKYFFNFLFKFKRKGSIEKEINETNEFIDFNFFNFYNLKKSISDENIFYSFIDTELSNFPLESLPILNFIPILRNFNYQNFLNRKETCKEIKLTKDNLYCIVNPTGDLKITEKYFNHYFLKEFSIKNLIIGNQDLKKNQNVISDHLKRKTTKILFYSGHGTGIEFFNSKRIKFENMEYISFIMGCSSAHIQNFLGLDNTYVDIVNYYIQNQW